LIAKAYRPIPGWALLVFMAGLLVLCVAAAGFVQGRGLLAILTLFYGAGLCAVALAVAPLGRSAAPALGLRGATWRPVLFGALGTVALSFAVSQLGIEPQGVKQAIDIARQPGELLKSLVVLAVLAPLVEELIFRGLLYGWIAGRWGTLAAWLVSSLAFAAAHFEPAHIVLVLPLGILFGWLRRRTDSLLPSLASHMVNNGFAVIAATYFDS
jgi:membrane protease YdiL (CAAX protease family)